MLLYPGDYAPAASPPQGGLTRAEEDERDKRRAPYPAMVSPQPAYSDRSPELLTLPSDLEGISRMGEKMTLDGLQDEQWKKKNAELREPLIKAGLLDEAGGPPEAAPNMSIGTAPNWSDWARSGRQGVGLIFRGQIWKTGETTAEDPPRACVMHHAKLERMGDLLENLEIKELAAMGRLLSTIAKDGWRGYLRPSDERIPSQRSDTWRRRGNRDGAAPLQGRPR